jgi:hypothetical protein
MLLMASPSFAGIHAVVLLIKFLLLLAILLLVTIVETPATAE